MVNCCVSDCKNWQKKRGTSTISFHNIPRNPKIRKIWLIKARRQDEPIAKINNFRMCSEHFLPSDFQDQNDGKKKLKKGVVPTIFKARERPLTSADLEREKRAKNRANPVLQPTPSCLICCGVPLRSIPSDFDRKYFEEALQPKWLYIPPEETELRDILKCPKFCKECLDLLKGVMSTLKTIESLQNELYERRKEFDNNLAKGWQLARANVDKYQEERNKLVEALHINVNSAKVNEEVKEEPGIDFGRGETQSTSDIDPICDMKVFSSGQDRPKELPKAPIGLQIFKTAPISGNSSKNALKNASKKKKTFIIIKKKSNSSATANNLPQIRFNPMFPNLIYKTIPPPTTPSEIAANIPPETPKVPASNPTPPTPPKCRICKAEIPKSTTLFMHMSSVHSDLRCTHCGIVLSSKYQLWRHQINQHSCPESNCPACSAKFTNLTDLRAHLSKAHGPKKDKTCSICDKSFYTTNLLWSHQVSHQSGPEWSCNGCPEKFASQVKLRSHLVTAHSKLRHTFLCSYCPKVFLFETRLRRHEKIHENMREFQCHKCPKRFNTANVLAQHVQSHDKSIRPFQCHRCGATFLCKRNLDTHLKFTKCVDGVRRGRGPGTSTASYPCTISTCGYSAQTLLGLAIHEFRHSDANGVLECPQPGCSKSYPTPLKLRGHWYSTHGLKRWQCGDCQKKFQNKQILQRHQKIHETGNDTTA